MATRNKVVLWPLFSDGYLCCLCGDLDEYSIIDSCGFTPYSGYGLGRGEWYKYSSGYLSGYGYGNMGGGGYAP
jgi:hypothetical protein